jgi:hypothetical protein
MWKKHSGRRLKIKPEHRVQQLQRQSVGLLGLSILHQRGSGF